MASGTEFTVWVCLETRAVSGDEEPGRSSAYKVCINTKAKARVMKDIRLCFVVVACIADFEVRSLEFEAEVDNCLAPGRLDLPTSRIEPWRCEVARQELARPNLRTG